MQSCTKLPRGLIATEDFLILSAEINYQLSPSRPNYPALAALILGPAKIPEMAPVLDTMECIGEGYAKRRRKLGPLALLHPLRATAILARSMPEPTALDVLGALLHDKEEDLTPRKMADGEWIRFDKAFQEVMREIDQDHQWYLGERISLMQRPKEITYSEYLSRILDHAPQMPDLLHVKLADRLDNTLDTHLQRPGVTRYNFYRAVFDILFVAGYPGVKVNEYHFLPGEEESVLLMSQLFKNTVFLSLIRKARLDQLDETTTLLFDAVAVAGIRKAQWIALELFASFVTDVRRQRELVVETIDYCYAGGTAQITSKASGHILDGTFHEYYGDVDDAERKRRLGLLFCDKEQLTRVILAFIAVFSNFLNDPGFFLQGIDRNGVRTLR